MSPRRKTYDGNFAGGSISSSERGDSDYSPRKTDKHASSKGTARNGRHLISETTDFRDDPDKDRYLITYADLITLLLGLFIILYAISNIDLNKYTKMMTAMENIFGNREVTASLETLTSTGKPKIISSGIDELKAKLEKVILQQEFSNSVSLEENARGITIHIMENILFASGKAELTSTSRLILGELAGILSKLPNDIRVEGHTDNLPINSPAYASNWHLSVARALNTAYFLINDQKINPEKVSIVGYAEYKPIADNTTVEGRAKNRRVDIVIIK